MRRRNLLSIVTRQQHLETYESRAACAPYRPGLAITSTTALRAVSRGAGPAFALEV